MQQNKGKKLLVGLIVSGFLFVGLLALGGGILGSLEAFASGAWPSVPGQVTTSRMVVTAPTAEGDSSLAEDTTMYAAWIEYTYQAGGEQFTGTRVTLNDYSSSGSADVEPLLKRYPTGKAVQVYYDPRNPASSVLEPGFSGGLWAPLAVGGLITALGLGMTVWYFRALRRGGLDV